VECGSLLPLFAGEARFARSLISDCSVILLGLNDLILQRSSHMLTRILSLILFSTIAVSAADAPSLPQMRMTPTEIASLPLDNNQIGSSGVTGVHTKVLYGDPSKAGFYSILLYVGPRTTIQAHSHRDDRMATVVSGEWHFGYGDHFDAKSLKTLPAGSVYSEPAGTDHFAQTTNDAVVVQICGFGPTDTHYFDPANDPQSHR
jgi:quercetin dioxygenase-like cupin family protein